MQCLHFKRFMIWNIGNFSYFHPQNSFILLRCYQCAVESCVYIKACGKLWRLKVVLYQVSYPFTPMIDIGVAGLFRTSHVMAWNCLSLKCKTMSSCVSNTLRGPKTARILTWLHTSKYWNACLQNYILHTALIPLHFVHKITAKCVMYKPLHPPSLVL